MLVAAFGLLACGQAHAIGVLTCTLDFDLDGWSFLYKTAAGQGEVRCDDGASLRVKLVSRGGGLAMGRSTITGGHGEFSGINRIEDVLGSYASAETHWGAWQPGEVQVVTKGNVSLSFWGQNGGWDVGVSMTRLQIRSLEPHGTLGP